MNYYKRHIGDYLKDTAHLSLLEHGIYTRLLDVYYTRESAIPDDQAARLVGARTKEELAALRAVLCEFFTQTDDGAWMQWRCEREITASSAKADRNREVGKRGGRPRKTETQMVSGGNPDGFQNEPTENPSHKPLAISQEEQFIPHSDGGGFEASVSGFTPTPAGAICRAIKAAGIPHVNPGHPLLAELLNAGASEAEFVGAAPKALSKSDPFAYLLTLVANQRKEAAKEAARMLRGELPATETAYARSMREKYEQVAPAVAAKAPGAPKANPMEVLDGLTRIAG